MKDYLVTKEKIEEVLINFNITELNSIQKTLKICKEVLSGEEFNCGKNCKLYEDLNIAKSGLIKCSVEIQKMLPLAIRKRKLKKLLS